jgi:hypothetical protein
MVGTDEERGWVGNSDQDSDLKDAGYGSFNRNPPYMFFPAAADLISAPPYRPAPLVAAVLLVGGVELHPRERVCLTSEALVDVERAACPSATSWLLAASSNTRAPPLIRPYHSRQKKFSNTPPPPYRESIYEN